MHLSLVLTHHRNYQFTDLLIIKDQVAGGIGQNLSAPPASLIDTRTPTLKTVDLPSSYTFRSLGCGDAGEALVLGTDGQLHVIDPEAGALARSSPVIDAWEKPEEWQSHPLRPGRNRVHHRPRKEDAPRCRHRNREAWDSTAHR
ncbi:hypothetical protein ACFWGN_12030 [Oerskovia sp. NPDC060338]|uniref:hypothetical protein n=1 Tax=Oerskovia sp. NPDC060338 TaxID=3347100 RepID=UPI00365F1861